MDPINRNQETQHPRATATARGQAYRGNVNNMQSRVNSYSTTGSVPGAREITPDVNPVENFTPNNINGGHAGKGQRNVAGVILGGIIAIAMICVGVFFGVYFSNNSQKTAVTDTTTTKTVTRKLSAPEISDLSNKVSYLIMAETTQDFTVMGRYRLFSRIAENRLTDVDRLEVAVRSLRSEYTSDETSSSISVARVAERYAEIFGAELKQAESVYCPSYSLSADGMTYVITGTCDDSSIDTFDLLYKDNYRFENGYAYVDVLVGSMFASSTADAKENVIYNDYYESNAKTAYKTIADFATPEEFKAFQITADNGDNFASYSLRFGLDDNGNYYYLGAINNDQVTIPEGVAPIEDTTPDVDAESTVDASDSAETTETTDSTSVVVEESNGKFISYETDPDAPPCPRDNPYAICD